MPRNQTGRGKNLRKLLRRCCAALVGWAWLSLLTPGILANGPPPVSLVYTLPSGTPNAAPQGPVLLSGSTLYGTTFYFPQSGGYSPDGVLFKVNTDGTAYQTLHS